MKGVIIAGGFGTRMRPLTLTTPKPILPICNKPFLLIKIEQLKKHGINDIILCLQYLPDSIKEVLNAQKDQIGVNIHYVIEDVPLGTAGAIKNAEKYFDGDTLVICNGDILTDLDITAMNDFHKEKQAEITIATTEVSDPSAFGLILSDQHKKIFRFLEKPSFEKLAEIAAKNSNTTTKGSLSLNYINAGTYLIESEVFEMVPFGKKVSIERETFPDLLENGSNLFAYDSSCYWLDLGTPEKYLQAHQDVLNSKIEIDTTGKDWNENIVDNETLIPASLKTEGASSFGKNVKIGTNCTIKDSVILDNVCIGDNVTLKECILGNHSFIANNTNLPRGSVIGDYTAIGKDN